MRLGIIGTAGRRDDRDRMYGAKFDAMVEKAKQVIARLEQRGTKVDCLVSGGAAWADHVAIELFLECSVSKLRLHFPCAFDETDKAFEMPHFGTTDGGTMNYYHRIFTAKTKVDSLKQIYMALRHPGCESEIAGSFRARNTRIAEDSEALLAMTFGHQRRVKPGGTEDTVYKFLELHPDAPTYHLDLNEMLCYPGIQLGGGIRPGYEHKR